MAKGKVDPDKIQLQGIRILKSHFEVDVSNSDIPHEVSHFSLGFKSESAFILEDNKLRFRLFIKIQGFKSEEDTIDVSGEYCFDFHYIIENMDDFVTRGEGEEFSVDEMLGATIAGISYSTSRGIILDRTYATDFNGVILPVINPVQLLKEDTFGDITD